MEKDVFILLEVQCNQEFSDILIAELAELGFDSFEEKEDGFSASVLATVFEQSAVGEMLERYAALTSITSKKTEVTRENWNEEWEKNYDPISVLDKCYIRATFHEAKPGFPYEIVINPKMSFGTGHHATTWLMVKQQMEVAHQGKRVLDVGTGTGILAIMAGLLGAKELEAFDIDDWSVENARENFELNNIKNVKLDLGTISSVKPSGTFDIILANINRNVLLEELPVYEQLLRKEGHLLLSGFYEQDIAAIDELANKLNLKMLRSEMREQWTVLVYIKPS